MALDAFHTIHKTSVFEFPRDAVEHLQGNGGRSDSTHLNNVHKRKVSRGRKRWLSDIVVRISSTMYARSASNQDSTPEAHDTGAPLPAHIQYFESK